MKHVAIVTSGHFSNNPRVWKQADALARAGYDVVVHGITFDARQAVMDSRMIESRGWTFRSAGDLCAPRLGSRLRRIFERARSRLATMAVDGGGSSRFALGYCLDQLARDVQHGRPDAVICHLESGLSLAKTFKCARLSVAVDFEDWHSENDFALSPGRRRLLRAVEQEAAVSADWVTTTSAAMAEELSEAYGIAMPDVVYNSMPALPPCDATSNSPSYRLIWLSQTISLGRGLEELMVALEGVPQPWSLELRGRPTTSFLDWVRNRCSNHVAARIVLGGSVAPDCLDAAVSGADIGLALELPSSRNKDLTASNKIFHYMQNGLVVVATSTRGQSEIARQLPEVVRLVPPGDVLALRQTITNLLIDLPQLHRGKSKRAQEANTLFGYERYSSSLISNMERLIAFRGRRDG